MTGHELFVEEMKKRGATPKQINSKAVAIALDVIENTNAYTTLFDARKMAEELEEKVSYNSEVLRSLHTRIDEEKGLLASIKEERAGEAAKQIEYIKAFNDALSKCETAEARDLMRIAQVYMNTVDVKTSYDNTAFIVGLSAILTKSRWPVSELKKINPKLAEVDGESVGWVRI